MARHPSMQALRAFEAGARLLSFQQAATELHLTPGAVSRQIQGLEAMLGTTLFQRHHKQVRLTPVGQAYLDEIRPALVRIGAATQRLRDGPRERTVSITAYPTFAIRWFMPRWSRFCDLHPGIDVRLTTSLSPVDFTRDDVDLAIQVIRDRDVPAWLVAHKIVDVALIPVCTADLAARLRQPEDLANVTLLHGTPRPQDWARWLRFAGVDGVDGERGLHFESLNLAVQAAIEGLGVAIAIEAFVRDDLMTGRLVRPFPQARPSARPMQLVYPRAKKPSRTVAVFRDWLLAEAAG